MATINEMLAGLFPGAPSYLPGLLGEDQARLAQQQAQQSGLLSLGASLLAAGGPSTQPISLGQALASGLSAGQQAYQNVYSQKLQEAEIARKMQEQQRLMAQQEAVRTLMPNIVTQQEGVSSINQAALSTLSSLLSPGDFEKVMNAIQKRVQLTEGPKPEYREVGGALYEIVPGKTPKPVVSPTGKLSGDFANVALGLYGTANVADLPQGAFENIQREIIRQKEAGRTIIDMTSGEKGFKNEMDLRKEFQGSPEYKSFIEMKSAWDSVQAGLKQNTPIGDVAVATKIMKLLDPGSVVRESELAIAMQATGALDRLTNYASNIVKGTKLTGAQKEEFGRLSNELYNAAVQVYNNKRNEYVSIAEDYGLDPKRIAGKVVEPSSPIKVPANIVDQAKEELKRRRGQ